LSFFQKDVILNLIVGKLKKKTRNFAKKDCFVVATFFLPQKQQIPASDKYANGRQKMSQNYETINLLFYISMR